jgi:DNA polymerase
MRLWNYRPDQVVLIDLETQSPLNLKKVGGKVYARHPMTRLMCLVAKRGREVLLWVPHGRYPGTSLNARTRPSDFWPEGVARRDEVLLVDDGPVVPAPLLQWIAEGCTFVAHNARGFDADAYKYLVADRFGSCEPAAWCDTVPLAKSTGLPGSLDALGKIFTGQGKDAGSSALELLYTAKMKGSECVYNIGTLALWKRVLQYNVKDVLLLEAIWREVKGAGEPELLDVDSTINSRGIYVDMEFLENLIALWGEAEQLAFAEIVKATDGKLHEDNLRSIPQVKGWLRSQGVQVDSLNRQVLERLYEYPEEFFHCEDEDVNITEQHAYVCEVLRLRQTVTRIGRSKLQRIKEIADPDCRVRDVLVAYGAHTGRWAGRGVQPHNFARGVSDLDTQGLLRKHRAGELTITALREAAARCKGNPRVDDVLSTITRPTFRAAAGNTLAICDYAAIEGRGVAWVAGEQALLNIFASGGDVYCAMASLIYGRPITKKDKDERQVGKVTVLGCGYSMSAPKFAAYCKANRLDLSAAGTTPEACVEAYRSAYPAIAGWPQGKWRRGGVWQQYQAACRKVIERPGTEVAAGRCRFYVEAGHLRIVLPSGRPLVYRDAQIVMKPPAYAALLGLPADPKPTIEYSHHHGYRADLYGGLITENIVQAICRDLLAHALVECERQRLIDALGLPVVLHVHDEVVCEVPEHDAERAIRALATVMSTPPAWASGFPIAVEGFTCPHYTKAAWGGSWVCEARNGEVLKCKSYG